VYDYHGNASFITLGTSRETSACVCDAIALAWQEDRAEHYPHAQQILLTFDAGAANAARSLRFKEDLVALSRRFGQRLRVALYPPYTSKRHPIEHRLFCHVARRLSGVILDSHQTALEAVQRTHTQTGFTVTPRLLDTLYELGRNVLRHSSISTTNSFAATLFSGNETTSSIPTDFRDKCSTYF